VGAEGALTLKYRVEDHLCCIVGNVLCVGIAVGNPVKKYCGRGNPVCLKMYLYRIVDKVL
jgi:hypothetical protein